MLPITHWINAIFFQVKDVPKFPKTKFQISPKVTWRINTQTYYKCSPLNNQRSGLIYNDSHKPSIFLYDWVTVMLYFFFKCISPGYHRKIFRLQTVNQGCLELRRFFFFFLNSRCIDQYPTKPLTPCLVLIPPHPFHLPKFFKLSHTLLKLPYNHIFLC